MKSCFFIGHREASSELLPILTQVVEKHVCEYGVTDFIVGGYGGFDHLAAKAVISLKQQYPQITLSLLIPYHPAERPIETPPGFDNTYYLFCASERRAFHRKQLYISQCLSEWCVWS